MTFYTASKLGLTSMDDENLSDGPIYLNKFFQKFSPCATNTLEERFIKTSTAEIRPNELLEANYGNQQILNFNFPPYKCAFRRLDGRVVIKYQIRNYENTDKYDSTATEGADTDKGAFYKPFFLCNLFKHFDIVINGQEIKWNYDYGLAHFVSKLVTIRKDQLEYERLTTRFAIPEVKYNAAEGQLEGITAAANRISHPLMDIPNKYSTAAAGSWTVKELETNQFKDFALPKTDDIQVVSGNLPHPLCNTMKLWPPEMPVTYKLEPNHAAKIFYSKDNRVPVVKIQSITFIDTVYEVNSNIVDNTINSIVKRGRGFQFPFQKLETNFYNLKTAATQDFPVVNMGPWPRLIFFGFIPVKSRTESKAQTTKFMSKFPPLRNITIYNGEQEYPKKGGITFEDIPDFPGGATMSSYMTEAQFKTVMESNKHIFDELRLVVAKQEDLPYLAWTIDRFFTCQCWIPINLTPYDRASEAPTIVYPKEVGDMRVKLQFKHNIDGDEWSMVAISVRDCDMEITPPSWSISGTF